MLQTPEDSKFQLRDVVEAQYEEDGQWYDAIVRAISQNHEFIVEFTEYGNLQQCTEEKIRFPQSVFDTPRKHSKVDMTVNSILYGSTGVDVGESEIQIFPRKYSARPELDDLNELDDIDLTDLVGAQVPQDDVLRVGDKVEAQYLEDGLWYNAEIEAVPFTSTGKYVVLFTDYDNTQECTKDQIRKIVIDTSNVSNFVQEEQEEQEEEPLVQNNFEDQLADLENEEIDIGIEEKQQQEEEKQIGEAKTTAGGTTKA